MRSWFLEVNMLCLLRIASKFALAEYWLDHGRGTKSHQVYRVFEKLKSASIPMEANYLIVKLAQRMDLLTVPIKCDTSK